MRNVPDTAPLAHATAVGGGEFHTCALLAHDQVRGWGENNNGQVGDGSTTLRMVPVVVRVS